MYTVVATGGKQYRVSLGQTLEVEKIGDPGQEISLKPILLAAGSRVLARPAELATVKVTAVVLDEHKGAKIRGFTYKSKSNQRRRWGHRQTLSTIKITGIETGISGLDPSEGRSGADECSADADNGAGSMADNE